MIDKARVFIAIPISNIIKEKIEDIQERLKRIGAEVKWVVPQDIHITIKFLGNINVSELENIYIVVTNICNKFSPFQISISSISAFPDKKRPKVIWIGVKEGKDILCKINKEVEDSLIKIGFKKEDKEFNPHITIGRVKGLYRLSQLADTLKNMDIGDIGEIHVRNIQVIKSQLTPSGPIYTILKEIPFKG
jgi:2'-5' RNA ligase